MIIESHSYETSGHRILVAEDDPISRSVLERYLEQEGYSFVSANNGREALDLFNREFFSIVITDWLMPEMDGTALCRAIRGIPGDRYTYLILVTAQNTQETMVEGLEAGADDFIVKPIRQAELRLRLKGARRILDLEISLRKSLDEIREFSIRDPLTGAFNRRYLDQQLENEIHRAYRFKHPISIIMCDLDHFKSINDTYGHRVGDEVLKRCVTSISKSVRQNIDWIARYGGEEFVVTLPETDAEDCLVVAERMRKEIASAPADGTESIVRVSASFGAVTLQTAEGNAHSSAADLMQRADLCLYQAKQTGRNRVVGECSAPWEKRR
jgi:two-component system cell cycle response regulator